MTNSDRQTLADKTVPELGSDLPGLDAATDHIMHRMGIALDDLLEGPQRLNRDWFLATMRHDIRYFVWLYLSTHPARLEEGGG